MGVATFNPPFRIAPVEVEAGTWCSPSVPAVFLTVEGDRVALPPALAFEIAAAIVAAVDEIEDARSVVVLRDGDPLTLAEAAEAVELHETTLRLAIDSGALGSHRTASHRLVIFRGELSRWRESGQAADALAADVIDVSRQSKGVSVDALAAESGIPVSTLRAKLHDVALFTFAELKRLGAALGIDCTLWLVTDRAPVDPTTPHGAVRALRIQAGLTLEQVAEWAGTSVPYLARFERGEHSASPKMLGRLAAAIVAASKTPSNASETATLGNHPKEHAFDAQGLATGCAIDTLSEPTETHRHDAP